MILQKLNELYERMQTDSFYENLAPFGYSIQKVAGAIIINRQGQLVQIEDLRHSVEDKKGKSKIVPHFEVVCGQSKPSGSGLNPCFLWDNAMYALGVNLKPEESKKKSPLDYFNAFKQRHLDLETTITHPDYQAFCQFLKQWTPDQLTEDQLKRLQEMGSPFLVFKLSDSIKPIHKLPEIQHYWETSMASSDENKEQGTCLVSGKIGPIATLHEPAIKGIPGAQASGAKLVSFNSNAFCSYGLEQGANAPVSEDVVFRYANALNTLLQYPRHHARLNGEVLVFWTENYDPFVDAFADFLTNDTPQTTQDEGKLTKIKNYVSQIKQHGAEALENSETKFYILGLAPNASRLSVRLWLETSVGEIANKLQQFFAELAMDDTKQDRPPLTIRRILRQSVRDTKNISPQDEMALLRVALLGAPYDPKLIINILKRIKADCASSDASTHQYAINFYRASILKAFLLRNYHNNPTTNIQLMSLDPQCTNIGYLLGRLFAVMEKIQERALGNVNASIRDKYYTMAATTPRAAYPQLERKMMKHFKKLGPKASYYEILVSSIMDQLSASSGYPETLSLHDRSFFTLGYYHQRQDFFKKQETPNADQ